MLCGEYKNKLMGHDCIEFVPHKRMFIIHFQIPIAGALLDKGRERSGRADDEGLDGRSRHRVRFASSSIYLTAVSLYLHFSQHQLAI